MIKSSPLKRIGTVAGAFSAAVLLTITQASAATAEVERAYDVNGPADWNQWLCAGSGVGPVRACFTWDGDWIQIRDGKSDGSSAVMDWEVRDSSNNSILRYGAIFNADGAFTTRYKNKDFPETNTTLRFRACLGHWSTKLITAGTCSAWVNTTP
ncbi:hypothetical protein [Streptomyces subrutilus]|uniref:hypothetical protein n=1 Tax=Streptomyces subrutilus TaxID=36818 RepID=UPI0033C27E9F